MIRFEIVRSNYGFRGRFVAANGQTVWWTENYTRRRAAVRAVELLVGPINVSPFADHPEVFLHGMTVEVRIVDERAAS